MKQHFLKVIIINIMLLSSCEEIAKNEMNTYYDNGNLRIEVIRVNEDKYLIKEYYQSGKLKSITEKNKEGAEHGNYKAYYPTGLLRQEATMLNGVLDGVLKNYYENGNLERSMKIKEGEPYGCCDYMYRKDGSLRRVGLYSYAGDLLFIARFDSNGNLEKVEGDNLTVLYDKATLKVGETIRFEIDRYVVPDVESEVFMTVKKNGDSIQEILFDESNILTLILTSSGKYTFEIASIFKDTENVPGYLIDSLNSTLIVESIVEEENM